MTLPRPGLSQTVHGEIARAIAWWADAIAQAHGPRQVTTVDRALRDVVTLLMSRNALGMGADPAITRIEVRGPLATAIEGVDPRILPESAAEWMRIGKRWAEVTKKARARAETRNRPDDWALWRGLREVARHLEERAERFHAKSEPERKAA